MVRTVFFTVFIIFILICWSCVNKAPNLFDGRPHDVVVFVNDQKFVVFVDGEIRE